jgi:hypothetical protein
MSEDAVERIADALRRAGEDARPRPDCPPPERLWGAVKAELPRSERLAILDHTTECPACAEAWRIAMTLGDGEAFGGRTPIPRQWWRRRSTATQAAAAILALAATIYLIVRVAVPRGALPTPSPAPALSSSPIVVALNVGGGRIALAEDGTLTAPTPLSGEDESRAKLALQSRKVAVPAQLAALKGSAGPLMGGGSERTFALVSPVATMVATDRPTLTWSPLSDALDYEATISDVAANYREVVTSPALREPKWTVPRSLARGRTYSWQVVARTPSGQVKAPSTREPEVRFQVISEDLADALAKAIAEHKQDHLLLALRYAEAGLMDEAEAELRALAAANPASSLPNDLLLEVRKVRNIQR